MPNAQRKTAVITGASSGVGRSAAVLMAGQGWNVIALGRDSERSHDALYEIRSVAQPGASIEMITGDLALLFDTARMADKILTLTDRVHALCNNAGGVRNAKIVTHENNEATFSGNHLGHFLLTKRLMPALRVVAKSEARPARIINVSSEGHRQAPEFDWNDLQRMDKWVSGRNYCLAKLCNLLFTCQLAKNLGDEGIVALAMHPGEAATNFASHAVPEMQAYMATVNMITPEIAGRTMVWLASSEEAGRMNGRYFFDCHEVEPAPIARDAELAARLWTKSEALLARSGF